MHVAPPKIGYAIIIENEREYFMTMMLKIDDKYISKFESFIASLPEGAVEMKNSIDDEIIKRVTRYENNQMSTIPFTDGLDVIREKLSSRL